MYNIVTQLKDGSVEHSVYTTQHSAVYNYTPHGILYTFPVCQTWMRSIYVAIATRWGYGKCPVPEVPVVITRWSRDLRSARRHISREDRGTAGARRSTALAWHSAGTTKTYLWSTHYAELTLLGPFLLPTWCCASMVLAIGLCLYIGHKSEFCCSGWASHKSSWLLAFRLSSMINLFYTVFDLDWQRWSVVTQLINWWLLLASWQYLWRSMFISLSHWTSISAYSTMHARLHVTRVHLWQLILFNQPSLSVELLVVLPGPKGSHGSCSPEKWKKIRPVEVFKLAIGPEKVLVICQCGPEKLMWPAYLLWCTYY